MNTDVEQTMVVEPVETASFQVRLRRLLRGNATQLGILAVFLVVWLFFIIAAPETFLSSRIYRAFMSTVPFFAIIAMPLTLAIIAGEIDLSFPSIMAMGMVAFALAYRATDSVALGVAAALAAGTLIGLTNGLIVAGLGIPSLVATLGTQFFWRGASLVILDGQGVTLVEARESPVFQALVGETIGRIPNQMWWLLAVTIGTWFLLNRHRLGAHIYLIGDNIDSARLMGVNAVRTRLMVFALIGLAAAFAGVLASFRTSFFWPSLGEGYLLQTLGAVFLGGTSVFGGVGTILGTFLGSFIIGAIGAAIVAIGLTGFWTQLIYGLILVISVSMHGIVQRRVR
ncbi:MAG: ABC transporter permease [Anaerolineae bacterium]|nr:ABC transporter permease [Anaerolineae bacterium]